MAKAKKSTFRGKKKSTLKSTIKNLIKQSVQPPPEAITPPQKTSKTKDGKKR
jgi:hypothetical protein